MPEKSEATKRAEDRLNWDADNPILVAETEAEAREMAKPNWGDAADTPSEDTATSDSSS